MPRAQCRAGHYPTVQQKFSPRSDSQSIVFGIATRQAAWTPRACGTRLKDGSVDVLVTWVNHLDIRRRYPTFVPVWLLSFYALARLP